MAIWEMNKPRLSTVLPLTKLQKTVPLDLNKVMFHPLVHSKHEVEVRDLNIPTFVPGINARSN